jgi:glycosyltransferase involved in cell wall biosynthesis
VTGPGDDRISVLHVAQPTEGGVASCVETFVVHQRRLGWRVVVACPPDGPLAASVVAAGAAHVPWRASRAPRMAVGRETAALWRTWRRLAPRVVHLHSSKAGLAGRLAVRGQTPTLFQPHAWSFDASSGVERGAATAWERWAVAWTHATVCVSRGEMERGLRKGVRGRYRIVPNGIDLSAWVEAGADERSEARRRLAPGAGLLVVCVGRLSRQKGQDTLVDAWRRVAAVLPPARLVLIGAGPEAARLRGRAGPGVELVGERADVADWLAAADVAVFPSRWEGMSLALLEAAARGCCIVATDVPGAHEVLRDGGGAIVRVGDRVALAEAILARLADPSLRVREGRVARRTVESEHDLRRSLEALDAVYEDVLDVGSGARRPHQGSGGGTD